MSGPRIQALLFDTFGTVNAVRTGTLPWTRVDRIYRVKLDEEERTHLNRVWHRLRPWPDAVAGLERLKRRYVIAPLSNSDLDCLVSMAKHAALPGMSFCAPRSFGTTSRTLRCTPSQVMMVAAHNYDLRAARSHGMATAFVPRPTEYGPGQTTDLEPEEDWDVVADDFQALASKLGC